jgi:hypothetical protein
MVAHQDVVCWQKDCGDIKRYLHRMVFTQWRDLFDQIQTNGDAMTQDEIIEMAIEVYGSVHADDIKFVKLVAAKEREATIKIIKETPFSNWFQADVIEAIRARGQA